MFGCPDYVTVRPIDAWPGPMTKDWQREESRFTARVSDTWLLLDRELGMLRAKHVVMQLAIGEQDLRLDGGLRSTARPDHPGVVIAFESKVGPLKYAVDKYRSWEENLRAIALSLEALRKVDRYGVTKRGEQYTGWKALPSGIAMPEVMDLTVEVAADVLAHASEVFSTEGLLQAYDRGDKAEIVDAFQAAAKRVHPDVGGDADQFGRVVKAKELLLS